MAAAAALLLLLAAAAAPAAAAPPPRCYAVSYRNLLRSNDSFPGPGRGGPAVWGNMKDASYQDVWAIVPSSADAYADAPADAGGWALPAGSAYKKVKAYLTSVDMVSFLSRGGRYYMLNHFEYGQPSSLFKSEMQADEATGHLTVTNTEVVDASSVGGLWYMCSGFITPWNSHLAGEEYNPDCRLYEQTMLSPACTAATAGFSACGWMDIQFDDANAALGMSRYWGGFSVSWDSVADPKDPDIAELNKQLGLENPEQLAAFKSNFKCYNFGASPEATVAPDGSTNLTKWRTLGRLSHEQALLMPDQATVYTSDDTTTGGFFMFKADTPRDLSAGSLFAAKLTETATDAWDVTWIKLGSGNQADLDALARSDIRFSDIFEAADPVAANGANTCPPGFAATNTYAPSRVYTWPRAAGGAAPQQFIECLRVKSGMETAAAFLETRRLAAMLGATTEFEKEEGITFSKDRREMYVSYSTIRRGMATDVRYAAASKDVNMAANTCGAVFAYKLTRDWVATSARVLLKGTPIPKDAGGNSCAVDGIAGPDNLHHINDILLIAEDSTAHRNNVLWAFDLGTGNLTRVLSAPQYAEVTGIHLSYLNSRHAYLGVAIQHPEQADETVVALTKAQALKERGYAGYIGPLDTQSLRRGLKPVFAPVPLATGDDMSKVLSTQSLCYEKFRL